MGRHFNPPQKEERRKVLKREKEEREIKDLQERLDVRCGTCLFQWDVALISIQAIRGTTSNPTTLQQLPRLDKSSPNFHDELSKVLSSKEYQQTVPGLQGNHLELLVDYLDKVCHPIPLPRPLLKPA